MRQYIGARYVPKFFNNSATNDPTWASGVAYESLIEVFWNGNTYISKKAVPASVGAPNLNPEYWANIGVSTVYTGMIDTAHIEDGAVTTPKMGNNSVTSEKIAGGAVNEGKIANGAITNSKIADESITREKLAPGVLSGLNNLWKGKKALIIGDSWCAGWDGSNTVNSWTDTFLSNTGMTGDVIALSAGGFTVKGSGTYANQTFLEALENVKNNEYDVVIVQDGTNDIGSNIALATPVATFINNCKTYFDCPVYFFLTVPFKFLNATENNRAKELMRACADGGYVTCFSSYKFSFANTGYIGNDYYHPNANAYRLLGKLFADVMNGGEFGVVNNGIEINSSSPFVPELSRVAQNVDTTESEDLWIRWSGNQVFIYGSVKCTSTTLYGFIPVYSGVPLEAVPYSNAGFAVTHIGSQSIPMFVNGGQLIVMNHGVDLNGKFITLSASYQTGAF